MASATRVTGLVDLARVAMASAVALHATLGSDLWATEVRGTLASRFLTLDQWPSGLQTYVASNNATLAAAVASRATSTTATPTAVAVDDAATRVTMDAEGGGGQRAVAAGSGQY